MVQVLVTFSLEKKDLFVSCLLNVPVTREVYRRNGSALLNERAATLRQKLQVKLAFSTRPGTLTSGKPAVKR